MSLIEYVINSPMNQAVCELAKALEKKANPDGSYTCSVCGDRISKWGVVWNVADDLSAVTGPLCAKHRETAP